MSIDKDTVRNIAFLARINVPDQDLDPMAKELSGILDWVEQLQEVNTDGVEPMASVGHRVQRLRADDVTDGEIADKALANAPESHDNFFLVPKVVE